MGGLVYAGSYRDLLVYKKSRELAKAVFLVSKTFPKEEMYVLTDQIRRSSRSIGAQIAESWGKRRYEAHFISKLTDADGEQYETCHWVETALGCGYITAAISNDLLTRSLHRNWTHHKARHLKIALLRRLGKTESAHKEIATALELDRMEFGALWEHHLLTGDAEFAKLAQPGSNIWQAIALDYANAGLAEEAIQVLTQTLNQSLD